MTKELQIPTEVDMAAFISKEAHDLKSPFNRAMGFLKLVLKGMDGPISEQAQEDLTVAYQNTQYTLAMMSALVDISRLGRGERHPAPEAFLVDYMLQQTLSEWTRKYHKENLVELSLSAPEVEILADEIMIRQCFAYWISYVNEFVQGDAKINISVEEQSDNCLFTIRSSGEKRAAPECDLTLYGFAGKGILDLHQGEIIQLEEDDEGALVQFSLPRA
jgi:signal transduction histidine kinase